MENNRENRAVEKVETIAQSKENPAATAKVQTVKTRGVEGSGKNKTPVKRIKTTTTVKGQPKGASKKASLKNDGSVTVKTKKSIDGADSKKIKAEQIRVEKAEAKRKAKAERDRIKAERREKYAAKQEEVKRQRVAKAEALAAVKLRKKEERLARRDMLKNESKEARLDRIAAEKESKRELKREKAELRARLLSEKRENKRILKEQKRATRHENKKDRRSRGVGGWIAAVISLGCAVLLLSTLLTFNWMYMSGNNERLENAYARAYYDLAGCVDNIDVNLGKLTVSKSVPEQQKLLTDITVQSELAESELQVLPLEDSSKYATGKFINQLGDYSKTLSYKLADGGEITDDDREILSELYRRNANLQQTLGKISMGMGKNFSFLTLLKPEEDNVVISGMGELENNSLEYPKMIYDGPFSDGLERSEAKGLTGSEVTESVALDKFKALFSSYDIKTAEVVNQADGDIPTYNISATTARGSIYAQLSKRGGRAVMFNCYEPCDKEEFTLEECREIAESFVKKAGFDNMKPVWETSSRAVAQFNFAYDLDGVTVYSDLVKVNVCMERGVVSALEATSYFYNHTEREAPVFGLSSTAAVNEVYDGLDVRFIRKALVPVVGGERAVYEVYGEMDGGQYFIYVDSNTGKEIQIFKVIESTEGTLLI